MGKGNVAPARSFLMASLLTRVYIQRQGSALPDPDSHRVLSVGDTRRKKGIITKPYTQSPDGNVIVCLDEMGPESAKSYRGRELVRQPDGKEPAHRARQEIDYERRGHGYMFGAFKPALGGGSSMKLKLTEQEKAILAGSEGEVRKHAMQVIVDYAIGLGADSLVDVSDVSFATYCPYPNSIHADRDFDSYNGLFSFTHLASNKAFDEIPRIAVDRCCNLATQPSEDYLNYLGIEDPKIREGNVMTNEFNRGHGINNVRTCTPHLVGHLPSKGEHLACSESSQVIFLNSVFGARVNCEGDLASGAAAIIAKIPNFGMHLDKNRMGTHLVKVDKIPKELYEWDLMGYYIGKRVGVGVPVLDIGVPSVTVDQHKSLGSAMTTSGQVDMYHVIGLTPEAGTYELAFGTNTPKEIIHYGAAEEEETRRRLDWATDENVDLVLMGCPHYSAYQIRDVASTLWGRTCKAKLLIMTPWSIQDQARVNGDVQIIEEAGGFILTDACPPMVGLWPQNVKVMATDSAKMAHYTPSTRPDIQIHLGSMQRCIESAVTGKW